MPHGNRIFQNAGETKAWSSLKNSYNTLQLLIRLDNTNLLSQATSVSIYCAEESAKSRSNKSPFSIVLGTTFQYNMPCHLKV